jgi:ABC-type amino acid transport system permease subunit
MFVYLYGVNVAFWDQWGIVANLDRLASGTSMLELVWSNFTSSFLWGQNASLHNIFFPATAMLLLASITEYNNLVEMYLILTCFLVTFFCLLFVFRDTIKPRLHLLGLISFLPVPFLVFSLRQHENILWGFQLTLAFAQAFSVLAFYLLHVSGYTRFKKAGLLAAIGSATVATYSAAPGLFVWPAGLLQILFIPAEKSTKMLRMAVWTLVGAAQWLLFLFNFSSPNDNGLHDLLNRPMKEMGSFLILSGRPLFGQESLALASGMLLVALTVVVLLLIYKSGDFGGYSFWLSLLLFSLLVAASITIGRNGPIWLASRYVTFSILAWIGVYAVLVKLLFDGKSYVVAGLLGILSVMIALSIPGSYSEGLEAGRGTGGELVQLQNTSKNRERAAFILATYESQPEDFLGTLNPRPELVGDTAPALESLGYNVFSEPRSQALPPPLSELSPVSSPTLYRVESVSQVGVDQENRPILAPENESFVEITGWAVDAEAEDAAGGVYVKIDDKLFPAFYGTDKSGSDTEALANRFGIPAYRHAVFERAIPVSEIGTGTHELSVIVLTNDREEYYRPDQTITFEVR